MALGLGFLDLENRFIRGDDSFEVSNLAFEYPLPLTSVVVGIGELLRKDPLPACIFNACTASAALALPSPVDIDGLA